MIKFAITAVFCRAVVVERAGQSCYTDEPCQVLLDGVPLRQEEKNVFSLDGLNPATEYTLTLRIKTEEYSEKFTTKPESVLLDVRSFGAAGDGLMDDTAKIQAAILACPPQGTVYLPAGDYLCTSLFVKSNMTLWLGEGTRILGDVHRQKYPVLPGMLPGTNETSEYNFGTWEGNPLDCFAALLTGLDAENVDIIGRGTLDGNAQNGDWWQDWRVRRKAWRPFMLYLVRCQNVRVQGITVCNAYSWTLHPYYSDKLQFLDMTVCNDAESPNTDGIDPESCSDVEILGCRISVGDDCIAIKSGKLYMACRHYKPTQNITVRNCRMERGHGGVVVGSEVACGVQHLTVSRCIMDNTDRGLRIKSRRGRGERSVLDDVCIENVRMENVPMPFTVNMFYFCDPDGHSDIVQSRAARPVDAFTPRVGRIAVRDVQCTGATASGCYLLGLPEQPIGEVCLENVSIAFVGKAAPETPVMADGVEPVAYLGVFAENVAKLTLKNLHLQGNQGQPVQAQNVQEMQQS